MKTVALNNKKMLLIVTFIMKQLIVVLIALNIFSTYSQDRDKKFALSIFSDPVATYKDGANLAMSVDYMMNVSYFKAQVFVFPDLRGKGLVELTGVPLGFNFFNRFSDYRIYAGAKAGAIFRDGIAFGTVGAESGLDINFGDDSWFIGVFLSYDYREDGIVWEEEADSFWRLSGLVRVGFKW